MSRFLKISLVCIIFIGMVSEYSFAAEKDYPSQPISLIIPVTPGGGLDLAGRALVDTLSGTLGQPVVPVNKAGGGMLIGGNAVATAKPDGYTIGMLMVPTAIPEVYRYFQEAPYTSADLKPICKMHNFVGVVVVKGDAPWNTFKEMVDHVRKNPGMKFGIVIKGGAPHLLMIAIEKGTKTSFTPVPHPGDADVVMNIIGGHIPIGVVSYPSGKAQIQAGNLKVLATYGEKRFELLPQVPTMVELGCIPAYYPSMGLLGPKNTPEPIINKISEAVKKCNDNPAYRQKIVNIGCEIAFENSDQFLNTLNRYKEDIGSFLNELGFVKK